MLSHFAKDGDLIKQLVDVAVRRRRVGQNHAEEVWNASQRLVADQRVAFVHQMTFDLRCHLQPANQRISTEERLR